MESTLQSLLESQSKGKLHFKVKKIRLNIFELTFDFNESEILTIDSTNPESGYRIMAEHISVDMHSRVSLISKKHLIIDSSVIQFPNVEITKYRDLHKGKVSLPKEISKV